MSSVIQFNDKWGPRLFLAQDQNEIHLVVAAMAAERLANGYYDDSNGNPQRDIFKPMFQQMSDADQAKYLLDRIRHRSLRQRAADREQYLKLLYNWMIKRKNHQYEDWEILRCETPELALIEEKADS